MTWNVIKLYNTIIIYNFQESSIFSACSKVSPESLVSDSSCFVLSFDTSEDCSETSFKSLFLKKAFIFWSMPVFFSFGSTTLNRRVVRLCNDPKAMATTVQARQITLYGILKSGVGNDTSKVSVCRRRKNSVDSSFKLKSLK